MNALVGPGIALTIDSAVLSSSTLPTIDKTSDVDKTLVGESPFPCLNSYSRVSDEIGRQPWDSVAVDSSFAQKYRELDSTQLRLVGASSQQELLGWRTEVIEATKGAIIPCDPTLLEAEYQGSAVADQTFALVNLFYYHTMLSFQPTSTTPEDIGAEKNSFAIGALIESQNLLDSLLAATASKFKIGNSDQELGGPG